MTKTKLMDKYQVYSIEISKKELKESSVRELIESLRVKIDGHSIAQFIATFDNYTHTKSLNGEIMTGMRDAQIIMFCFGSAIPNNKITAVRPRSIGICEFEDKFTFDFMEAPKDEITKIMENWVKSL